MISTSGAELLPGSAVEVFRTKLLPLATVLTPNLPEAMHLVQKGDDSLKISNISDLEKLAKTVQAMGPQWVLLKGGHVALKADLTVANSDTEKETVVDILYGGPKGSEQTIFIQSPYQNSTNTHGTGCTLACKTSNTQIK
jgi:hydroxymethylpyrimidine/phosphomethylpyrimidine kinase